MGMSHGWSKAAGLLLIGMASLAAAGCAAPALPGVPGAAAEELHSKQPRQTPSVPAADLETLAHDNAAFAVDLFRALRTREGNLFYSPHSISLVLAMTYGGARSTTAQEMAHALHFTLPPDRLHPAFNSLDATIGGAAQTGDAKQQGLTLRQANAVWGQRDYHFDPAYLDLLAAQYGAGLRLANFASTPEAERSRINAWVSQQTEKKIDKLLPEGALTPDTRLVLTNAIYFKATWRKQFEQAQTHDGPFTRTGGDQVTVPTMHLTEPLGYAAGDGYEAVELPYTGDASMVVLLPKPGQYQAFEAALTPDRMQQIVAALKPQPLQLAMPKFQFTSQSFSLKQILSSLGMPNAFEPGKADFSGMDGTRQLFIQDAFHQAAVVVDEKGTEAAAATGAVMGETSAMLPPTLQVNVDRPFIFLIRDTQTGELLFMGRIEDPRS